MSSNPLVSLVIPVYNVEKYLAECLDSVLNQTYKNIEVICVNDGSPDNSEEIIDKYLALDNRVHKINKKNQGLNAARESGVAVAKGEYTMFVDSDDMIAPDAVELLLGSIIEDDTDIAVGGYREFYLPSELNTQPDRKVVRELVRSREDALQWLLTGNLNNSIIGGKDVLRMIACAKLYNSELLKKTDWNFSNYRTNEDEFETLQWYRNIEKGLSVTTQPVYFYRKNPNSKTRAAYSNISPDGVNLNRFEFAYEWYKKTSEYLQGLSYELLIQQRFIWMIQGGVKKSLDEGVFDKECDTLVKIVADIQQNQESKIDDLEKTLSAITDSLSWKVTSPARKVSNIPGLRASVHVAKGVIKNPRKIPAKLRSIYNAWQFRDAWIITDRPDQASDNGIILYDYLAQTHKDVNAFYVIKKQSPDYEKLKSRGVRVIDHGSEVHRKLVTHAAVEISAFFNFTPFDMSTIPRRKPIKRVFILHGMDQSDLSEHYARMGLDMYAVVTKDSYDFYKEKKSIVDISSCNIQLTGMPRYDILRVFKSKLGDDQERDTIVFAPTWRRFLLYRPGTVEKQPSEYLRKSRYFHYYNEIFNSTELRGLNGKYNIVLIPHPEMLARIHEFDIPSYISICTYEDLGTEGLYELASKTRLFISDFSSTTFDFAFLGANIAHFNFDEKDYYSKKQELYRSWFYIDKNGFGPSFKTPRALRRYLQKDTFTKKQDNINAVWNQIPLNSSEAIYRNIIEMLGGER